MTDDASHSSSICIGCGCTDRYACEGGCSWLARQGRVGVCSNCRHALPAWEAGACAADFFVSQLFEVYCGDRKVIAYRPGTNQPRGVYYVVDFERATVRLVDYKGLPYVTELGDFVRIEYGSNADVAKLKRAAMTTRGQRRADAPDAKRGRQLKQERARTRAKAAASARQASRRRSR
jgi:hypothetical protein